MTTCFFSCFNHFFITCLLATKFNIILNRILEQINILEDKREITHKRIHIIVFDIYTTKCNATFIYIPESSNQVTQS